MKQLNKPGDNMGGILQVWAVPVSDISIVMNYATFVSKDNVIAIYCTPGTIGFTEKHSKTAAGDLYDVELLAKTPKDSEESISILNELTGKRWVIIYLDQNEQYKVVGSPQNGLHFSSDFSTGSETSHYNGHSIRFYGKQAAKSVAISNPFI